jgi:hypothetical protein
MKIKGIKKIIDASLKAKEKIVDEVRNCLVKNNSTIEVSEHIIFNDKFSFIPIRLYEYKNEVYLVYKNSANTSAIPLYELDFCEIQYVIDCIIKTNIYENERH